MSAAAQKRLSTVTCQEPSLDAYGHLPRREGITISITPLSRNVDVTEKGSDTDNSVRMDVDITVTRISEIEKMKKKDEFSSSRGGE